MRNLLYKECALSASKLSFLFILFSLFFFIPNYPILVGAFFVTLGIFQSFQHARESGDILFSALLPISRRDVVKGKFLFVCLIELIALMLMGIVTLIRLTVFRDFVVYRANALMTANGFALGLASVIFGLFNLLFVGGYFKTAYKFAGPFVTYLIAVFPLIGLAEALHYFPGLGALNAFGFDEAPLQTSLLLSLLAVSVLLTCLAYRMSCARLCKIDL